MTKETESAPKTNGYHRIEVGERVIEVPGFKSSDKLDEVLRSEEAKGVVAQLHKMGKDVFAKKSPGKIILYVGAVGAFGAAVAGTVYLRRRKG